MADKSIAKVIQPPIRNGKHLFAQHLIVHLVLAILFLLAFGSSQSAPPFSSHEVNHHNSYLGAIEYNEYGTINTDHNKPNVSVQGIFISLIPFILTPFLGLFKFDIPKPFLWPFIRLRKLKDNLLPKQFQSRMFVPCSLTVF